MSRKRSRNFRRCRRTIHAGLLLTAGRCWQTGTKHDLGAFLGFPGSSRFSPLNWLGGDISGEVAGLFYRLLHHLFRGIDAAHCPGHHPEVCAGCVIGEGTRRLTVIFSSKTSISTPWVTMTCALLEFAMLTFPGVEYAGGQHQYQYSQQDTLETRCFYLITGRHMSKPKEIEHKWIPTKPSMRTTCYRTPPPGGKARNVEQQQTFPGARRPSLPWQIVR